MTDDEPMTSTVGNVRRIFACPSSHRNQGRRSRTAMLDVARADE
jgi:hypothetical protein